MIIHSQKEQHRITLYFDNKPQKEKVINAFKNIQYKNNFKKIGDAAEFVVDSMNGDLR